MRLHARIVRFLVASAWDVLLPDFIDLPLKIGSNFYKCFLAEDPAETVALLAEARNLTDTEIARCIDALSAEWRKHLPGGKLNDAQAALVRHLVLALHSAAGAKSDDPAEGLRLTLNSGLLAGRRGLDRATLSREQRAIGQTMLLARGANRRVRSALGGAAPHIPGHQLRGVLGQGGYSVVYLALHEKSNALRAIKVGALDDAKRFSREANLLRSLASEHVVRCHEHGELPDGRCWIAMDYLGEITLADLVATRLNAEQALLLAEQVLRGLAYLHNAGVLHRDIKPENAMVDGDLRLRLIDLGLAKTAHGAGSHTQSFTQGLAGTAAYLSPEQVAGAPATLASDMWAFGCVLYELLTGKSPFSATNLLGLGVEIQTKSILLNQQAVPAEVRPFLARCLERAPAARWANAAVALQPLANARKDLGLRVRHERYCAAWELVLEKRLLEQFARQHQGRLPNDAAAQFAALAKSAGVGQVDEERLSTLLPPIFAQQQRVAQTEAAAEHARRELDRDFPQLTDAARVQRTQAVVALTAQIPSCQSQVRQEVERLLALECRSWQEKQAAHAAKKQADAQRRAENARRRVLRIKAFSRGAVRLTFIAAVSWTCCVLGWGFLLFRMQRAERSGDGWSGLEKLTFVASILATVVLGCMGYWPVPHDRKPTVPTAAQQPVQPIQPIQPQQQVRFTPSRTTPSRTTPSTFGAHSTQPGISPGNEPNNQVQSQPSRVTPVPVFAPPPPPVAPLPEYRKFNGIFHVLAFQRHGIHEPLAGLRRMKVVMNDGYATFQEGNQTTTSTCVMRGGLATCEIDSTYTNGPSSLQTTKGIYHIAGDRITLCYAPPGRPRPRRFESTAANQQTLYTMERVRTAAQPSQVVGQLSGNDSRDPIRGTASKTYPVELLAGKTYRLDLRSAEFDAYLRLSNPEGVTVAYDDNGGGGICARINYTCTRGGRYRVHVCGSCRGSGQFLLEVAEE